MKNLILVVAAIASLNSFASEIDCAKSGSKITMDKKEVIIENARVPMTAELSEMAGGDANVGVKISFPKKDLKCSTSLAKVFNCTGKTKKASVTISISKSDGFGSSNMELMRKPIKIENIDISSSVGSSGPIVLGSESTTVALDSVNVKSSMFVKMKGDFQLDMDQVFNSAECK